MGNIPNFFPFFFLLRLVWEYLVCQSILLLSVDVLCDVSIIAIVFLPTFQISVNLKAVTFAYLDGLKRSHILCDNFEVNVGTVQIFIALCHVVIELMYMSKRAENLKQIRWNPV